MDKEETVIDQALKEIAHQWKRMSDDSSTVEYIGIPELCHFLDSCGIDIPDNQRYELTLNLRNEGYKESRLDGELRFHFYGF